MGAVEGVSVLSSAQLAGWATAAGFDLVGFARAEPIPPAALTDWLAQGHHADLDWMQERLEERLDPRRLLPGARTAVALASNYWRDDAASPVARYARGRDYHATHRDRLRALRRQLRAGAPSVHDYGSVDANPVMEKVWAVRAGLGVVAKNGCLVTPRFGSWVVLAVWFLDAEVDAYAAPAAEDRCGKCRLCIDACPTSAIVQDRVVDARACLSYQTIENEAAVPGPLREAMEEIVFGCDVCQQVCPLNDAPLRAHERFAPRALATKGTAELAALTRAEYDALVPGTPLARAGYDGLRRNAAYALGAARDVRARAVLELLCGDDSPKVREAAAWALSRFLGP